MEEQVGRPERVGHRERHDGALRQAEAEAEQRKFVPINVGIGLNSGIVCVGNMGSDLRFDYSVLGDDVNLASRLEAACKQYHARILLSENTRARLRGTYRLREVDRVVVKGKTEPVAIHEQALVAADVGALVVLEARSLGGIRGAGAPHPGRG